MPEKETPPQLFVDLSASTGAIRYGASGFLYGLGKDEIPSANMLAPLKPQVAAQKPEDGLQHPNGDALNVSNTYLAAGGREIEIYIQDMYPSWPYDHLGIEDYLGKVEQVVRQVEGSPNKTLFSYVPFNEPDQIWYNKSDKKELFFKDWKTVFQKIRSLAPAARIVGPNFCAYDPAVYRDFLVFGQQNNCLPDVISWHELGDGFFQNWYNGYEDLREIERSLGLLPREICINEYCRIRGDLGIPGQMIQWITRFENSKVDACLAYWTDAGSLNNLVTRDHYNQATGSWWLYRWYGSMTGDTVQVTPPDANKAGLQGLAALDPAKKQARILLGGASGDVDLTVTGLGGLSSWGAQISAAVWVTHDTGLSRANDPAEVLQENFEVVDGQITITLKNLTAASVYLVILTPLMTAPPLNAPFYPAVYADISGNAAIRYGEPASVECAPGGCVDFVLTAQKNDFYKIRLHYATVKSGPPMLHLELNGAPLTDLALPVSTTWADAELDLFLTAGINRLTCQVLAGEVVQLRSLELAAGKGWMQSFEAEAGHNTLGGSAAIQAESTASNGKIVTGIGNGEANFLEFSDVDVPQPGLYRMVVYFANADFRGGHSYNSQVVDRFADIQVNEQHVQRVYFRNTFSWENYQSRVVDIQLKAGKNRVRFFNPDSEGPHIDKIEIATPL